MDNILQDLYHGLLHPEEEYQPAERIRQERKHLDTRQQTLLERIHKFDLDLSREANELFEAENVADAMEMEDAYIQGMRMGAKLALALLNDKTA